MISLRFADWPMRVKMALMLLLASLLPLAIATALEIHDTRAQLKSHTAGLLAARGDQLADQLDVFHRGYQAGVDKVARLPNVKRFSSSDAAERTMQAGDLQALLQVWPTSDKRIRGVGVLDLSGTVIAATEAPLVGTNLASRAYVRRALAGVSLISDLHLAETHVGHAPTIAYVSPVRDSQGKSVALAVVWVRAEALWEVMRDSNELAGTGSFAVLFDQQGIRIGHTYNMDIVFHPAGKLDPSVLEAAVAEGRFGPKTREYLEDVRAFPEQFDRALAAQPDRALFRGFAPVNQRWNFGVARRFETVPWTVFYMVPDSALDAQIEQMTQKKALLAGTIGVIALLFGAILASAILRPIQSLSAATASVAKGALSARVAENRNDELGQLGRSFNAMAVQIEAQSSALKQSRDELEVRVEQRTAEALGKSQELIAERTLSEKALRESQERLHAVVENITEGVVISDLDGNFLHFNRSALDMLGFANLQDCYRTLGEYVAFFQLSTLDGRAVTVAEWPMSRLLAGDRFQNLELQIHRIDQGWTRIVSYGGDIIVDALGRRVAFLTMFDITQHKQAEAASIQQQQRLEGVVNSAMDGIVTIDENQQIVLINSAAEMMFGRNATNVLGHSLEWLLPERFRAAHLEHVKNFGRTGVAARSMGIFGAISGLRANGEEFPIEASISQVLIDGRKLFTVTCRDVTERAQAAEARSKLEAQLHQSQKMDAFGQLAAGVAHDFNNLLTVISGYSDLLINMLSSGEDDLRSMAGEIRSAAGRAATLTRQLLAFSRQQIMQPRVLDLNDVVGDIEKMMRRLIGEDIRFFTVLRPNLSSVRVDPGQIEQVIMNLCVNARDAMPQGGNLTIETAEMELDETYTQTHPEAQPGKFVMLAISDTGSGMSREIKSRIFEPFFTTKGVGKGTGLGLAVVHGIVKQSGGSIEVYSEVGTGTTFKVFLPAVLEKAASSLARVPAAKGGRETILLVEDEEGVRRIAALALDGYGYTVLTASGGKNALDRMANYPDKVDLLVTDVVMPEMNGRVLAQELLLKRPGLKVLFLSGYTDDAIVRHGALGADVAFLQKPFTPTSLACKVREVLDREPAPSSAPG